MSITVVKKYFCLINTLICLVKISCRLRVFTFFHTMANHFSNIEMMILLYNFNAFFVDFNELLFLTNNSKLNL